MNKLKQFWQAETPLFARVFQALSVGIALIPKYYDTLPVDFQTTIPKTALMYVSIAGVVVAVCFNFFQKKTV